MKAITIRNISVMIVCLMLAGGWMANRGDSAAPSQPGKPLPPAAEPELAGLIRARYEAALRVLQAEQRRMEAGWSTVQTVFEAARRALGAQLELTSAPAEQLAAHERHLDLCRGLEQQVQTQVERRILSQTDLDFARYGRLNAEIELLRAKGKTR